MNPANPAVESVRDEVIDNVSVVHACTLLDAMYGKNLWMDIDNVECGKAMMAWVEEHSALYYSWEGPSYMRLAKRDNGVRKAVEAGKPVVVIEALS